MKKSQPNPNKAVIYCRVSSDRQVREGDGLRSQETSCRAFAEREGYNVVKVFRDEGVSGGLNPDERPAAAKMFAFLDTQKDRLTVIVDDVNRVARSHEAHLRFRANLNVRGADLVSPNHKFGTDPDEMLVTDLLVSVASYQREANRVQVCNRQKARLLSGFWTFGQPAGYSYVKDAGSGKVLVRDEPKASFIAEAFEGFAAGRFETVADVARFLTRSGAFGKRVYSTAAKKILTNILYTGQLEYPAWGVTLREGKQPAITDITTFLKVQERLGLRVKAPYRKDQNGDFPLRGFVLCSCCGQPLTAAWSTGRISKHPYYRCKNADCGLYGKSLQRDKVEGALEDILMAMTPGRVVLELAEKILRDMHRDKVGQLNRQLADCDRLVKRIDMQIEGFMQRLLETDDRTIVRLYENKIKELEHERQLRSVQAGQMFEVDTSFEGALGTVFDFLRNPHGIWVNGDLEDKRLVLKLCFARRLPYNKETGFGTAGKSLPFEVLGDLAAKKVKVVEGAGFEPT